MDPNSRRRCQAEYYDGNTRQCTLHLGHEGEHTFAEPGPLSLGEVIAVVHGAIADAPDERFRALKQVAAEVYDEHFLQPNRTWPDFLVFVGLLMRMVATKPNAKNRIN